MMTSGVMEVPVAQEDKMMTTSNVINSIIEDGYLI